MADLADHLKRSVEPEIEDRRARLLALAWELLAGKEARSLGAPRRRHTCTASGRHEVGVPPRRRRAAEAYGSEEDLMPKINVYLPDALASAVKDADVPVSAVCQTALDAGGQAQSAVSSLDRLRGLLDDGENLAVRLLLAQGADVDALADATRASETDEPGLPALEPNDTLLGRLTLPGRLACAVADLTRRLEAIERQLAGTAGV